MRTEEQVLFVVVSDGNKDKERLQNLKDVYK